MNENTNQNKLEHNKYLKMYELNPEGLRLYGQYKKEQMFSILKWSFVGTAVGVGLSSGSEVLLRRSNSRFIDYVKATIFVTSIMSFTFLGIQASAVIFRNKTSELAEKYGKEIK